MNNINIFPA
jgi:hypothetical protein